MRSVAHLVPRIQRALDEVLAPHATAARVRVAARLPRGGLDLSSLRGAHALVSPAGEHVGVRAQRRRHRRRGCPLRSQAAEMEAAGARLKLVQIPAAGTDNVDVAAARRAGVAVCHTPGVRCPGGSLRAMC